jgi:hypothetical protein
MPREKGKERIKVGSVFFIVGSPNCSAVSNYKSYPTSESQLYRLLSRHFSEPDSDITRGRCIRYLRSFSRGAFA